MRKKKFRKVIKNAVKGKSVVRKYADGDFNTVLEEVVYAMPPFQAMVYYYYQFILKDFAWERYPKYIEGMLRSANVVNIWYYTEIRGIVIKSMPYTGDEEPKYHGNFKKSTLPPKRQIKKKIVLKPKEEEVNATANTNGEVQNTGRKPFEAKVRRTTISKRYGTLSEVERPKSENDGVRKVIPFNHAKRLRTAGKDFADREQEVKVYAECSLRQIRKGRLKK